MRKENCFALVCGAALALFLVGCASVTSPTAATLQDSIYNNRFFKFQIRIPPGWTISDKATLREALEVRSSGKKRLPTPGDTDAINHQLLFATESSPFSLAQTRPGIMLVFEDVRSSNIRTGKEYQEHLIRLTRNGNHSQKNVTGPFPVKLAGKEFYRVDMEADASEHAPHQACFARIEKGYCLFLVVTADSVEEANHILALAGFPQN